jgi:hypothetical protein
LCSSFSFARAFTELPWSVATQSTEIDWPAWIALRAQTMISGVSFTIYKQICWRLKWLCTSWEFSFLWAADLPLCLCL